MHDHDTGDIQMVPLRDLIESKLGSILSEVREVRGVVDGLAVRVATQNGRVDRLEMAHAVLLARQEERDRAAAVAAQIAETTAKRHATLISTAISLAGLLLGAVGYFVGR